MSSESYLSQTGLADAEEIWSPGQWLPQRSQVVAAVQLRIDEVIGQYGDERENEDSPATTSMRQGIGLIVVLGLLAGALPFFVNWLTALQAGTALPLAQLARSAGPAAAPNGFLPIEVWRETVRTMAGIDPWLPGWLAAFLSALGVWITQPLNWLTVWLAYGLGVLVTSKCLGATTTLQRFYAATSYAFTPLLLTALSPIPCVGGLATLVGAAWFVVMYVHAVYLVSGLEMTRALLSVVLPVALAVPLGLVSLAALIGSLF
jgi:hypothetical protein